GNGDGTFQPVVIVGDGFGYYSTVVDDFDNDGKLDIVTGAFGGLVSVLLGEGDGTFLPRVLFSANGSPQSPWRLTAADVNQDGRVDLIVPNPDYTYNDSNSSTINVLLNQTGTGTPRISIEVIPTDPYDSLNVANQTVFSVRIPSTSRFDATQID